jgi:hypothetical protein
MGARMVERPSRILVDWRRLFRWGVLATLAMMIWLLAPVIHCSWVAFRDTPISEYDEANADPSRADEHRLQEGEGFFTKVKSATRQCYRKTPLLGQEVWKRNVLFVLLAGTLLCFVMARVRAHQRRRLL